MSKESLEHSCPQDWSLADILAYMSDNSLEIMNVTDGDRLVGIVTRTGLENAMTGLKFNPEQVTPRIIFSNLSITRI